MMINFPNQAQLDELMNFRNPGCLTMYLPFTNPNAATNPNRIELKNLLAKAEKMLVTHTIDEQDVRKTLRPVYDLLENDEFWPPRHESLAIFANKKFFRYFHLPPQSVTEMLKVDKQFHLEPFERAMHDNKQYYLLALSHNHVQLYEGDHYQLKPVELAGFPTEMKSALRIDEYPQSRETHSIAPASKGKGSEAFHEQYDVSLTDKSMLLEFFRLIDRRLHALLNKQKMPLIIGGVNYLLPIYRKVNTYPGLVSKSIKGNLDRTDLPTIRTKAGNVFVQ